MIITNQQIKSTAYNIGFDLIGILEAKEALNYYYYQKWIEKGFHADMNYLSSNIERRKSVNNLMSECKTVISLAVSYNPPIPDDYHSETKDYIFISRYALGYDYHDVIAKMCKKLILSIKDIISNDFNAKYYIDTGAILERDYAVKAGLGQIGRNCCLINPVYGSYIFLAEILLDIEIEADKPARIQDICGSCRKCIKHCPTGAINEDFTIDSNKCLSYHTIENKNDIPTEIAKKIKNRLYGCDLCQEVCPHNSKIKITKNKDFFPRKGIIKKDIEDWFSLSEDDFKNFFSRNPIKRLKYSRFIRNLEIVKFRKKII